ncbi:hypothetical protein C2G38_2168796 [Gigaspora rosea]|uniref:Uncharacterized protein n=1 Tax=Gigaspora rosea TaxID=44941 RepID=A0A397VPA5_9GLOM|nr:hypothetical protein C2G38_2168796 [Gigaspora rosea]
MDDATNSAFDVLLGGVIPLGYSAIFEPVLNDIVGVLRRVPTHPIFFFGIFLLLLAILIVSYAAFISSILCLVIIPANNIYVKIGLNINLLMLLRLPGIIEDGDKMTSINSDYDDFLKKRGLVSVILFGIQEDGVDQEDGVYIK